MLVRFVSFKTKSRHLALQLAQSQSRLVSEKQREYTSLSDIASARVLLFICTASISYKMSVCANYWECDDRISNGTNSSDSYYYTGKNMLLEPVPELLAVVEYLPWMWAMFGSILVGLSGVLPLLVIPLDQTNDLKQGG